MDRAGHREARAKRRAARQGLLIEHGLDTRSLIKAAIAHVDPKFLIAAAIIGLFALAFLRETDKDTRNLMVGALIAAFAGAWGYYLGSSRSASLAADRADKSLEVAHAAVEAVKPPNGDGNGDKVGDMTVQAETVEVNRK